MNFNIPNYEWKNIPQNIRYIFMIGALLIFTTWLIDHWDLPTGQIYCFFGFDIRNISFSIGLLIIFFGFGVIIIQQIWLYCNTIFYKHDYPIKDIDKEFYLVWFSNYGILYLFDKKTKLYRHVYDIETAQDLFFLSGTHNTKEMFEEERKNNQSINIDNTKLEFKNYNKGLPITIKKYYPR